MSVGVEPTLADVVWGGEGDEVFSCSMVSVANQKSNMPTQPDGFTSGAPMRKEWNSGHHC